MNGAHGKPSFSERWKGRASRLHFMGMKSLLVVVVISMAFWAQAQEMPSIELRGLDRENRRQFFSFPFRAVIHVYRNFMGKGRKSFCPMTPSCSTYGQEALKNHGAFWGSLMTADRLHRCGHDSRLFPRVRTSEGGRFLDLPRRLPPANGEGEVK